MNSSTGSVCASYTLLCNIFYIKIICIIFCGLKKIHNHSASLQNASDNSDIELELYTADQSSRANDVTALSGDGGRKSRSRHRSVNAPLEDSGNIVSSDMQ